MSALSGIAWVGMGSEYVPLAPVLDLSEQRCPDSRPSPLSAVGEKDLPQLITLGNPLAASRSEIPRFLVIVNGPGKAPMKSWSNELAKAGLVDSLAYLDGLSPDALRTSCGEADLVPYDTPAVGIHWSHKTTTFDDARALLKERLDSAGNDARKIMDVELTLIAERLSG